MADLSADLLTRWGEVAPGSAECGRNLLERWGEPHRRYHTTAHLAAVLDRVALLGHLADDQNAVLLAAWFHDAVYDLNSDENEECSARLAEQLLPGLGIDVERTAEVARLVRLTAGHLPSIGDRNGEVLCDADLAVLGGTPVEYEAYAASVREEYGFLPDETFDAGRADVLRRLLGLPTLFRTPLGHDRWEDRARRNLEAELTRLDGRF